MNTYLDQVTETELLSVPGLQPLREDLLSAALEFYSEFTAEEVDDPELLIEIADAQYRLGRIYSELGDYEGSSAANADAIRLFEQLREERPDDLEVQAGLAHACYYSDYDRTVKLCQSVLAADPQHDDIRALLAETYNSLAISKSDHDDIDGALKLHQEALPLRESLLRDCPDNPKYLGEMSATVNNLGVPPPTNRNVASDRYGYSLNSVSRSPSSRRSAASVHNP